MEERLHVEHVPGAVLISGELTAESVSELRDTLFARLADESSLELDLSGLRAIDARGAELLMHLRHEALTAHKALSLVGTSHAVCEQLDGLSLGRALSISPPREWS